MRKGSHHSQESKAKLSASSKGRIGTWIGRKHTQETKAKMRAIWQDRRDKGVASPSEETRKKLSLAKIGNQNSKGEKCVFWKGGISPINMQIRASKEYKYWRTAVFQRDNYKCVWCGAKKPIQADHIKPFSTHIELRFDVSNGRTLCSPCHRTTDTYGVNALKYA